MYAQGLDAGSLKSLIWVIRVGTSQIFTPKKLFHAFSKTLQVFKTQSFKVSRAASAHHAASAVSPQTFLDKFCQAKLPAGGLRKEMMM